MRLLLCLAFATFALTADVTLPEKLFGLDRTSAPVATPWPDAELAAETGFQAGESASFGAVNVNFYRFVDTTGAYAALSALPSTPPTSLGLPTNLAYRWQQRVWLRSANLIFSISGLDRPAKALLAELDQIAGRRNPAPPPLPTWFPTANLIPGSERYLLGPLALARFQPKLSPQDVQFENGAEAATASYLVNGKTETLVAVSYPTPQMAQVVVKRLESRKDLFLKRDGPIFALIVNPQSQALAQQLGGQVQYNASFMELFQIPKLGPNPVEFMTAFAKLSLLIMVLCIALGLAFAAFRLWRERRPGYVATPLHTTLHLND